MTEQIASLLATLRLAKSQCLQTFSELGFNAPSDITQWPTAIRSHLNGALVIDADYYLPPGASSALLYRTRPSNCEIYADGVLQESDSISYSEDKAGTSIHVSYKFSGSTTSLQANMFSNTMLQRISLPNVITSIPSSCFSRCVYLQEISGARVSTISSSAFWECSALSMVNFPALTDIGDSAFSGCVALESFQFPSLASIGSLSFTKCNSLTSVSLPASVSSIGDKAFANCTGLTSFDGSGMAPSGMKYMFSGCSALEEVRGIDFSKIKAVVTDMFLDCSACHTLYADNIGAVSAVTSFPIARTTTPILLASATSVGSPLMVAQPRTPARRSSAPPFARSSIACVPTSHTPASTVTGISPLRPALPSMPPKNTRTSNKKVTSQK